MTWAALVHVVISGLATGSIYALMALSLVIVYNATRTLNFAQGEMLMVSTFVGFTALQVLRAPLLVALLVAVVAAALLGRELSGRGRALEHLGLGDFSRREIRGFFDQGWESPIWAKVIR